MQTIITFREGDTLYSEAAMTAQAFALSDGTEIAPGTLTFTASHINRGTYLFASEDITVPALISVTLTAVGPTTVVYDGTIGDDITTAASVAAYDHYADGMTLHKLVTISALQNTALMKVSGWSGVDAIETSTTMPLDSAASIEWAQMGNSGVIVSRTAGVAPWDMVLDFNGGSWIPVPAYLYVSIDAGAVDVPELSFRLWFTDVSTDEYGFALGERSISWRTPAVAAGGRLSAFVGSDGLMVPYSYTHIDGVVEQRKALTVAEMIDGGIATESAAGAIETAVGAIDLTTAGLSTSETEAAAYAALEAYDISHSSTHAPGTTLSVSELVGAAATAGPRTPRLVSDLFTDVRLALNDVNKNVYSDALMTSYYNRAISECWNIMVQIGAEVIMNTGTIVADGVAQDYELPTDFRAFVPNRVIPRSPVTATTDYTWGTPFAQVGLLDRNLGGNPTTAATPKAFCVFWSGNSQYIRFSTIPPAGENYDFQYYPEYQRITEASITATYTPWLGLLDSLLARILEEFCREGLEFVTTKREAWRMKAENDLVVLLGLRHLLELTPGPSLWKGFPL